VPKNNSFSSVKDSDVLSKIIGQYSGLSKDIASTSIQHESLSQLEVTDWDFINMRAEANGQVIIVDDGKKKEK
jgi:phage protein D